MAGWSSGMILALGFFGKYTTFVRGPGFNPQFSPDFFSISLLSYRDKTKQNAIVHLHTFLFRQSSYSTCARAKIEMSSFAVSYVFVFFVVRNCDGAVSLIRYLRAE